MSECHRLSGTCRLLGILTFLAVLITVFSSDCVPATPSRADWFRQVFIGHDSSGYFCLLIHRTYPGTYFEYSDSVFLCRLAIPDGATLEKILVGTIVRRDTSTLGDWITIARTTRFSAERYIEKHRVSFEFPTDQLDRFGLSIEDGNLLLGGGDKKFAIAGQEESLRAVKTLLESSPEPLAHLSGTELAYLFQRAKVSEYFMDNRSAFFVIRTGFCGIELTDYQYVIYVPASRVHEAMRNLERR